MKYFLYSIAAILIILWAIGYLGYHSNGVIHILLIIALITILFNLVLSKKGYKSKYP